MTTTISNQSLGPQTISSDTTYVNDTITAGNDGVTASGSTAVVLQGTTITAAQRGLVTSGLLKLSNSGTITSGTRVAGYPTFDAVQALSTNAVVLNMGTISAATDSAVSGEGGLAVTNAAGATLAGGSGALFGYAIQFDGGTGSFDNFGIANAQGRGVTVNTNLGGSPTGTGVTITLEAGSMTGALSLGSQDDTVNLYTGAVTTAADTRTDPVSGAAVTVRAAGTYGAAGFGAIALGGGTNTLNLHGAGDSTTQHVTANGAAGSINLNAVTGASVINKLDSGSWIFNTTASGVAAPISLQAGAIQATAAGAFGTGAITASGGSLEYSASGSYANAIALQTTTHLTVDAGLTATLSGAITGTGGAIFDGAGTAVLTNSGTGYTGPTTVSGGTLALDATGFGSQITVTNGILRGTGVSTLDVFIYPNANAIFAPGEGTGTFTSAGLASYGTFVESITGTTTFGQARVTEPIYNVLLGGQLQLTYTGGAEPLGTVYRIIDNIGAGRISGTFSGLNEGAVFTSNGHFFQISYVGGTGNDVTLTDVNPAVPVFTGVIATAQLVVDNNTIKPFATVLVTDANAGQTETLTVSFTAASGTLSNLGAAAVSGGVATYTVSGTPAAVSSALQSAIFKPTHVSQGAPVTTTFTITDSDGLTSTSNSTTTVQSSSFNNPPLLSGNINTMAHNAVSYVEQAAPVAVNGAVTVTDLDTPRLVGATVKIIAGDGQAGDTLHFTNQNGITGVYNAATYVLTLSGSATTAQYQTALESVTFDNTTNDDPTAGGTMTARDVSFVVDDGQSVNNLSASAYVTINITAVNDPPALAGGGNAVAFAEQGAVVVNPSLTISDPDGPAHLIGATVTISANAQIGDTLHFTNQNGITGVYDATTHVLTLSGSALKSQYRAILDAVTFDNTTRDPTAGGSAATRTISFVVDDGQSDHNLSPAATTTINLAAVSGPLQLSGGGNTAVYTLHTAAPVAVNGALTVSDPSSTSLIGATVTISANAQAGDALHFANQNGITGVYDATTHVLSLSGSATAAQYQAALESVTFDNQTVGATPGVRTVSFQADDGQASNAPSSVATTTLSVILPSTQPTPGLDFLTAQVGGDAIHALSGDDTIIGGSGHDSLYGDDGNDLIILNAVTDNSTVYGGLGNDVINASRSTHDNYLSGDNGDDSIVAGSGGDTLIGGDGNDTLIAGSGRDQEYQYFGPENFSTLSGGLGNDFIDASRSTRSNYLAGGDGDDTLIAGSGGRDQIYGNVGNDLITIGRLSLLSTVYGGKGNDVIDASRSTNGGNYLSGDLGDDSILAGSGHDSLFGGDGNDTLIAGSGQYLFLSGDGGNDLIIIGAATSKSLVFGGDGADTINASASTYGNYLGGNDGNDSIIGGSGADTLIGGYGNDTLIAGRGQDLIYGGVDGDLVVIGAASQGATVYGGSGSDTIDASASTQANLLSGDGFDDDNLALLLINGIGGNDSIIGGSGADTFLGGDGNDTLIAGSGQDQLYGNAGNDLITIGASNLGSTVYAGQDNDVIDASRSTHANLLSGDRGDDSIVAGSGADTLLGGDGNDTLVAGGGQDQISGGADNDRITIGASNLGSTVYGGVGNDVIDASRSTHANYLSGDVGDDSIMAGSGADTLFGGDGADTLIAGSGHDQIFGNADNDSITIGALTLSSTVYGGKGNDVIDASASNQGNLLSGDLGNDTILTGKGGDTVYGAAGSDTIRATSGAVDTLHVGLANSSAVAAADATELDHILNFGAEDKLVFDGGVAGTTANTVLHGGDLAIRDYATAYAYAYGDSTHAAAITGATQYAVVNDTAGHVYVFAANHAGVELDGLAGGINGVAPGQFLAA